MKNFTIEAVCRACGGEWTGPAAALGTEQPFPFPAANALVWCTFYYLGLVLGGDIVKAELPLKKGL